MTGRMTAWLLMAAVCLPLLGGCGEPPVAVEKGPAPDFTIKTFDGGEFKLSDHKGAPVAINFFASWCLACGAEAADIEMVHKEFIDRNVAMIFKGSPMAIPGRLLFVSLGVVAYGVLWANLVVLTLLALVDVAAIIASMAVFVREVLRAKG